MNTQSRWAIGRTQLILHILVMLCVSACAPQTQPGTAVDSSRLPPEELLAVFLNNVKASSPVTLSFKTLVRVDDESPRSLRGFAGYTSNSELRVKLIGAVGFTVLDYVSVNGKGTLLLDKLTPDGDEAAKEGLLKTMQDFTLALAGSNMSAGDYVLDSIDAKHAYFTLENGSNESVGITLERKRAVLTRQVVHNVANTSTTINYENFENTTGFWVPGTMNIQSQDSPVLIELTIDKWRLNAQLPKGFFTPENTSATN